MGAAEQGVAVSRERFQLVPRVLCVVFHGGDVLLLKGAPDKKIWPGRYNFVGGHVERGESLAAAARREIREETGLEVADLHLRGVVTIDAGEPLGIGLYVFTAQALSRECAASAEGALEWVPAGRTAGLPCVPDVPFLLARLASDPPGAPPFTARYHYDSGDELVIRFDE
jgi:8-oxo-dGTP diphosphatase